jgi:hypothetical protein
VKTLNLTWKAIHRQIERMEQKSSQDANSRAATQKITRLLSNLEVYFDVLKRQYLLLTLSRVIPAQNCQPQCISILSFHLTLGSSKQSLTFIDQKFVCIINPSYAFGTRCISHPTRVDKLNNGWWPIESMAHTNREIPSG